MKNDIYPLDLIQITTQKDSINQTVERTRVSSSLLAEIGSVSQTEFFSGGRIGLQPSVKATIYEFEYNDEPIAKIHYSDTKTKVYSIYRTYSVPGTDKLELYMEERGGTKDEPSSSDSSS